MTGDLQVVLAGDVLITRPLPWTIDAGLSRLADIVRSGHVSFANLESCMPTGPLRPSPKQFGILAHADPRLLGDVAAFGFDVVNLANNHALDFMEEGLLETVAAVGEQGLVCVGAGATMREARRPRYVQAHGHRVAVLGGSSSGAAPAADPDGVFTGRAGVSPLRFCAQYQLEPEQFAWLRRIDEAVGAGAARGSKEMVNPIRAASDAAGQELRFLGCDFVEAEVAGMRTWADPGDLDAMGRSIGDARRQADVVIVSMHCHEGARGMWNTGLPADFVVEYAHSFIDSGADVCVGHGPHQVGGIEIRDGRPIFYSLGNFVFMVESVDILPVEFLATSGLQAEATASDFHDRREKFPDGSPRGFVTSDAYWQSILPVCHYADGQLTSITVWPVALERGPVRHRRGVPRLAVGPQGDSILRRLCERSEQFGTRVEREVVDGVAVGRIRPTPAC